MMMMMPRFPLPPGIGPRAIPIEDELRWGNAVRDLAWAGQALERLRAQARDAFGRMINLLGLRQQAIGLWGQTEREYAERPTQEAKRAMDEAESLYREAVALHRGAEAEVVRLNAAVRKAEASLMDMRRAIPQRLRGEVGRVPLQSTASPTWARFAPTLPRLSYWGT